VRFAFIVAIITVSYDDYKTVAITETPFENWLHQHGEEAWAATLTTLLRSIHEVDKNATQIWFAFLSAFIVSSFSTCRQTPTNSPGNY